MYGLCILIAIIALSFRKSSEAEGASILDIKATTQLKGLAILLVIVSHLNVVRFISLPASCAFAGAWGVAMFLLLSGFGLTQSYVAKGLQIGFIPKRFKKVIVPYMLVTAVWLVLDVVFKKASYSILTIVLGLLGLDYTSAIDPTMWFVTFIIAWYLIFFAIFSLPMRDWAKAIVLLIFAFAIRHFAPDFLPSRTAWQWGLHAYPFVLGVALGLSYRSADRLAKPGTQVGVFAILACTCLILFGRSVAGSLANLDIYAFSNIMFSLGAIACTAAIRTLGYRSTLLVTIGYISYELYLFEWMLLDRYSLLSLVSDKWLGLALYLAGVTGFAILLQRASCAITRCNTDRMIKLPSIRLARGRHSAPTINELPLYGGDIPPLPKAHRHR
jgi:peptidoglycan/LPS O-acetylase OafA/YrhL